MKTSIGINRRTFLQRTTASTLVVSALPSIVPATVFGAQGQAPASERVTVGCIGVGDRGSDVMGHFLNQANCRIVAVCDVKKDRVAKAKAAVDGKYKNTDCQTYSDFRELLARKDIDAVLIASTDNWHVLHALAAVRAGKDLYVEKPLGLSLGEDQALRKEVLKHKRVFQFGTQQRSDRKFRVACELVRNGCIGQLKQVNIWAPGSMPGGSTKQVPPPATLDYEFWLGPAPYRPHTESLTDNSVWWYVSDFALGFIAGWGIHPLDIALWGAGDLVSGEVEIEGKGHFPTDGVRNTATTWDVDFRFNKGLNMKFVGVPNSAPGEEFAHQKEWQARYGQIGGHGTAFEGTNGWVFVNRDRIAMHPEDLIDLDPEKLKVKLVHSPDHVRCFLDAVKTRQPTVSSIESAVLSDAFCHVSDITLRLQRKLTYDVGAEKFKGGKEANQRLQSRRMRAPWKV
jgi:glucose-fructose oxidoreductase